MPRKKSKAQRAIEKEKAARKAAAAEKEKAAKPNPEKPDQPVETPRHLVADVSGSIASNPVPSKILSPTGQPFMRQPSGRRSTPVDMRLEAISEAGDDCWHYQVTLPRNADLSALFNGIRSTRPREESGTIYIRTDIMNATSGNAQLIYDYTFGMFMRRVKDSQKELLLANLLDQPIVQARASGGWGRMDYFINIACAAMQAETEEE